MSQQAGVDRLLEEAVRDAEEDRADDDRPPVVAQIAASGEDEAAKGQFFADRRHRGHAEDQQPQVGRGELRLQVVDGRFISGAIG